VASTLMVCFSVAAISYARKKRLVLDAASTVIEGHSIDSLNLANLRQRVNKGFMIQEAFHSARIQGSDLELTWKYIGFCRTATESAFEFSIHADAYTRFDQLNCVGFDLGRDPNMAHEIHPVLVGADGISKTVSVPFLKPVTSQQPFGILLKCTLPNCMRDQFSYYTSNLSFAQDSVGRCEVRLEFDEPPPLWVRVYERTPQKSPRLVKSLPPSHGKANSVEYVDAIESRSGQSTRVYVFWRDTH
jgi:hypothetical protein